MSQLTHFEATGTTHLPAPVKLPAAPVARITTPQYRLIRALIERHPERKEVLDLLTGLKPESAPYATDYARRWCLRRFGYMDGLAANDPAALRVRRRDAWQADVPEAFTKFQQGSGHRLTYAEASKLIAWLSIKPHKRATADLDINRECFFLSYASPLDD